MGAGGLIAGLTVALLAGVATRVSAFARRRQSCLRLPDRGSHRHPVVDAAWLGARPRRYFVRGRDGHRYANVE